MFPVISRPLPRLAPLAAALALAAIGSASASAHAADAYATRLAQRQLQASDATPAAAAGPATSRATLAVTSCADDADPGTLRNVIASAAEGDVIDLRALTCATITLTQGEINLGVYGPHQIHDLSLVGPGRDALAIDANGGRGFVHGDFQIGRGTLAMSDLTIRNGVYTHGLSSCLDSSGNVVLERVTITDCHASNGGPITFGGAVAVSGKLTMRSSTISDSSSTAAGNNVAFGGGAYVMGDAELIDSTISGNRVTAAVGSADDGYYLTGGGGLYVRGNLSLTRSTVSGNRVEATNAVDGAIGGGVFVRGRTLIDASTLDNNLADGSGGGLFKAVFSIWGDPPPPQDTYVEIANSTIADNRSGNGGGLVSSRPVKLSNSTVAGNQADARGGGLWFLLDGIGGADGTLTLQSTILADNRAAATDNDLDTDGTVAAGGASNLVRVAAAGISLPADTLAADPQLFPLSWNGGGTRTMALGATSPALDAGNNDAALAHDQRGEHFARSSGAGTDIGAFEAQRGNDDDTIFKDGFDGAASTAPVEYAYDDGDATADGGNIGPPSSFSPDMLWGNYYPVQPGGEFITRISVAFGPTFPSLSAANPVTFWLLQDDDADGDPTNAHAVASVQGVPDVFNDNFFSVDIPPTWVHGAIFVGASAKLAGGQDRPARIDGAGPQDTSWFFYAPDIPTVINDLASAPYAVRMDVAPVARRGTFMVRAQGQATP